MKIKRTAIKLPLVSMVLLIALMGCTGNGPQKAPDPEPEKTMLSALEQLELLIETAYEADRIPRTVEASGEIRFTGERFDWTEGFFPGSCWEAYQYNGDAHFKTAAEYFQNKFADHRFYTRYHDLGFVFNNSFGAGYRLTGNDTFKNVLIEAGNSLIQRFDPTVGCIKSWDVDAGWQSQRGWKFPVIIDNMMNLEMLFNLSELTNDPKYRDIAISHANVTVKNHFRDDFSSFHVVDFEPETGEVRGKETAQGYAHESAWARGQAWGLYGFTMCYRYTGNADYLKLAENIADYVLSHPNLPDDQIPYWDFNAPKIPDEPRDASAAAIIASALIELNGYSEQDYLTPAKTMVNSLSSENYRAKIGENHHFILMHSVGSIPHGAEIDVPLNYADYYFLEALLRLIELETPKTQSTEN